VLPRATARALRQAGFLLCCLSRYVGRYTSDSVDGRQERTADHGAARAGSRQPSGDAVKYLRVHSTLSVGRAGGAATPWSISMTGYLLFHSVRSEETRPKKGATRG
jgi:hypothetical protein